MKMFKVSPVFDTYQVIMVSENTYSLWQKWNESQSDEDWAAVADAVSDELDPSHSLEFYIEEAEPIG